MDSAIRIGATNHFALQAVKNRKLAIRELITERWRAYLPSVGVTYNRVRDINIDAQDQITHEIKLNINQVLYDGGKRSLDLDIAKIESMLAREDARIIYNKLRLDIQKSYLAVLAAAGKISLNKKSLDRAIMQLKQVRLEEKVGLATRVQVLVVASRVREIELALKKAQNEYKQSIHNLKLVLNLDFEIDLELKGDFFRDFFLKPPVLNTMKLIRRSRSMRPEIIRARTTLHKLKKEREIAKNSWIPRLSVGGYVGRNGVRFPMRQKSWGINFTLTFPIGSSSSTNSAGTGVDRNKSRYSSNTSSALQFFDDLSYNRRVLESNISLGESIANYKKLRNEIAIEVQKACDSIKEFWETIRIGNGRVYFRYESLRIMITRYRVGDTKREDILFAELELVQAQEELIDTTARYMIAAYELEYASGMNPGSLKLFHYKPGEGNTLLKYLVSDDFGKIKKFKRGKRLIPVPKSRKDKTKKKKKYLLDDVTIE